jgi:hypothetical protein
MEPDCLHCQLQPARRESKFCSETCRDEFAKDMAEAICCHRCDAQADGIADAVRDGWTGIDPDPEGTTWNYLGLCPDCPKEDRS